MNRRRRKRTGYSESGSSSDIAFLLIIYFIVIAGFNVHKGLLMHLPVKDSVRLLQKEDLLRFEMDSTGQVFYLGLAVPPAGAEEIILSGMGARSNRAVILQVSPQAPWQKVVSFVETAQKLEVEAFSFSIMPE
ncbi:MAG: biopolymer transporter ExbD [Spirochaetales bacterium]|jgi:biopolymer transport protein ExbD|nr:biopolymer transporter ExbD [Spirochaetales bacterium]